VALSLELPEKQIRCVRNIFNIKSDGTHCEV